jgi:serine/threonine-protein kinase
MPSGDTTDTSEHNSNTPKVIAHYRILKRLGKGGMGEVFLGEDTRQHGRKVALKLLPPEFTRDESRLRRFKQEARAILTLNHPNILTIFEIGESNGTYYIATEYIEGETLRHYLWNNSLKIDEALGIAIQIAMALEAAHAAGIVHRDVKPENIMLRPDRFVRDRFVKVLDFGLAKLTERDSVAADPEALTMPISNTNPGSVIGTTGYMSPEQAQGETIDTRTDIFSLGVVLYEMVAGHAPFAGPTDSHVRVSIIDHEPEPLRSKAAEAPRHLERIVSKSLAKDKAKRYQTVTDFKLDLEQLREELHLSQSTGGMPPRLQSDPRTTEPSGFLPSGVGIGPGAITEPVAAASTVPSSGVGPSVTSGVPVERGGRNKTAIIALAGVVLILLLGASYLYFSRRAIDSVAVLPFANDSNDPNAEYLSDGITESIISSLSQLPNLKVMSRNAVFRFKGKNVDPQEIGRSLKVGAVLAGRLVKQGDRLIIKTELINVADGSQIWGAEYNNNVSDLLAIQDEIAHKISEKLRLRLTGQDEEKLAKRYTKDADAYELYLKGRYFWNKRTEEGLRSGIKYFQQAEEKDPHYALAYSGLADSYALLSDIGVTKPADEMPKAKAAAQHAVDIDPSLAEGYTSRAFVKLAFDWDWLGAESDFKKALELNSKYPTAHQWYASYLMQMGKFDHAKQEIEQAHQLDPLSPIISANSGLYSYYEHNYDDAIEKYKVTLDTDPDFGVARNYLALAHVQKRMYDDAISELRTLLKAPSDGPLPEELVAKDLDAWASLGFAYAMAGKRAEAEAILKTFESISQRRYVSGLYFATIYAGLKDNDHAIAQLNKAFEGRHPGLVLVRIDPVFDSLRSDERFKQLVGRFEPIP